MMARNHVARLRQLERRPNHGRGFVVVWSDDGVIADRWQYDTLDGRYSWQRAPGESVEAFQRRVSDDAERIANQGLVVFLPFNARDP